MKKSLAIAGCLIFFSTSATALDLGVGLKVGTVGPGVDLSVALTKRLNARVSLSYIDESLSEDIEISDADNSANLDADLDFGFGATGVLLDWYVFNGGFHLTAGMMRNTSKIDLDATITDATVVFDGTTYNVATDFANPSMGGEIAWGDSFEPYIGVGWGRKAGGNGGLSFTAEVGVMLLSPEVKLEAPTATNPANQATLDEDVRAAESSAEDDLEDLEAWPVLSLGVNYAF